MLRDCLGGLCQLAGHFGDISLRAARNNFLCDNVVPRAAVARAAAAPLPPLTTSAALFPSTVGRAACSAGIAPFQVALAVDRTKTQRVRRAQSCRPSQVITTHWFSHYYYHASAPLLVCIFFSPFFLSFIMFLFPFFPSYSPSSPFTFLPPLLLVPLPHHPAPPPFFFFLLGLLPLAQSAFHVAQLAQEV